LRQSAQLFQRQADPPLALTVTVPARRVDVVDRAAQRRQHRGNRSILRNGIEKGLPHIAQRSATHRNRWHLEQGRAEPAAFQKLGPHLRVASPRLEIREIGQANFLTTSLSSRSTNAGSYATRVTYMIT
jgi:hypothetical protein